MSDLDSSIPALQVRPDLVQGPLEALAVEHIKVLGRHGIGMIHTGYLCYTCEIVLESPVPALQNDNALSGKVAGPQKK